LNATVKGGGWAQTVEIEIDTSRFIYLVGGNSIGPLGLDGYPRNVAEGPETDRLNARRTARLSAGKARQKRLRYGKRHKRDDSGEAKHLQNRF
jgi:hypothetical protein